MNYQSLEEITEVGEDLYSAEKIVTVPAVSAGRDLFYQPGEQIFSKSAHKMASLGWPVFPQERSEKRSPAKVQGKTIKPGSLRDELPDRKTLDLWSTNCGDKNVAVFFGPAAKNAFAVDIDVLDEAVSLEIQGVADRILGRTEFRRVGKAPKIACLYRFVDGDDVANVSRKFMIGDEEHGIEILSAGKALTVDGIHHKTGEYFKWKDYRHTPYLANILELPVTTSAKIDEFMAEVDRIYKFSGNLTISGSKTSIVWGEAGGISVPHIEFPPEYPVNEQGLLTDNREAFLSKLVFATVVLGNGDMLLAARDAGGNAVEEYKANVGAAILKEFSERAVISGRWASGLNFEVATKLSNLVGKVLSGFLEIKPKAVFIETSDVEAAEIEEEAVEIENPIELAQDAELQQLVEQTLEAPVVLKAAVKKAETVKRMPVENPEALYLPLGHADGRYFFITRSGELRKFTASDLSHCARLIEIDTSENLEARFPTGKAGFSALQAAEALMMECEKVGRFSARRIRGRGLWFDAGRTILHLGNNLIVDGVPTHPRKLDSKFIYSLAETMEIEVGKPLTDEEGTAFVRMMQEISWKGSNRKGSGALFAGWLVSAAVCGGLDWRPHAYISAEKGSGKGWILNNIVKPSLGAQAFPVKGKTSEASIRRSLGSDARPTTFDEFESQNAQDRRDKQAVLDLARASSEEDDTSIHKASSEGDGVNEFKIRSSFLFLSINLSLSQAADESRTIVFEISQPANSVERKAGFDRCAKLHEQVITEGFSSRFLGRALRMLPVIRSAAKTFKRILVRQGREDRTGDTWGTAMACSWCLMHSNAPTDEEASAFILENAWDVASNQAEAIPEWRRVLDHLVQQKVFVSGGNSCGDEYQIGTLVSKLAGYTNDECGAKEEQIRRSLGEFGIRVDGMFDEAQVLVANQSNEIAQRFDKSDWAGAAWKTTLARADTATKMEKIYKFGALASRCTSIKLRVFSGD